MLKITSNQMYVLPQSQVNHFHLSLHMTRHTTHHSRTTFSYVIKHFLNEKIFIDLD